MTKSAMNTTDTPISRADSVSIALFGMTLS
jgi:hypothetical protein